ncbi:hypothetical protein PRIPAC_78861 [Pristionchus pacificus]|uniref:Uncharacterized protein n=1 Tax=Pristionchus pacificus TaxID=54126 RepID=A0A2A6C4T0_PRIPA|nr:hypothetical protein PRIPAC_78861 [Pristionchus pacificus]|eukprot:PDM73117.1 hypothetical protein PRIPAC_39551 [Pristionchus pacificus]
MDLLRHYPIYPGSCLILYTSYLIPVGILLVTLQRSLLPTNCRIILTVWAIGMAGILTNEMYLMIVNMTLADGEFISKSLQDPPQRPVITVIHSVFYICMSALELFAALEQLAATHYADSLSERRSIFWYLVPYLAIWSLIAWYTAKLAFVDFNILVICVTFITVEISSILINYTIYGYCKRRYATMLGWSSLDERYHVRETRYFCSAMFPTNIFGFFAAALVSWIYAFYHEQVPYFVLEGIYQTLHATSCAGSAIMLMKGHPKIKRESLIILNKWHRHIPLFPSIQVPEIKAEESNKNILRLVIGIVEHRLNPSLMSVSYLREIKTNNFTTLLYECIRALVSVYLVKQRHQSTSAL